MLLLKICIIILFRLDLIRLSMLTLVFNNKSIIQLFSIFIQWEPRQSAGFALSCVQRVMSWYELFSCVILALRAKKSA